MDASLSTITAHALGKMTRYVANLAGLPAATGREAVGTWHELCAPARPSVN